MKKALLFLTLAFGATNLFGQSLEIVSKDSLIIGNPTTDHDIEAHAVVKNVSGATVGVMVKRLDSLGYNNLTDNNAICWGTLCAAPFVSEHPDTFFIASGAVNDTGFVAHVYPDQDGVPYSGSITYRFYNYLDESDYVDCEITFQVGNPVSIREVGSSAVKFEAYPNPVTGDELKVSFKNVAENSKVELHNLLGQVVYVHQLNGSEGVVSFDVSSFKSGVYFYTLKSGAEKISTKKLIIK